MYISVAFMYMEVTLTLLIPFQFHSELEELYLKNFIKVDIPVICLICQRNLFGGGCGCGASSEVVSVC